MSEEINEVLYTRNWPRNTGKPFCEQPPGPPLIHSQSRGNNLFRQNKLFTNPFMCRYSYITSKLANAFILIYILYGLQSHTLMSANKGWLTASGQCWGKMDWEWVNFGIRGSHRFSQKWTCLVQADLPPLGLSRINQLWAVEGWHHQVMRISGIMNGSSSWSFFEICSLCCPSSSIHTLVWEGFQRKMRCCCHRYTWP